MKTWALSLFAVFVLTGCASSSVLVGTQRPPIDPSQVKIYLDPPPRYEKVALLDAGSRNSFAITDQGKTNKVIERMKVEAADLGANGILLGGMGDQQIGSVGSGQAWGYGNTAYGLGMSSGVFQKKGTGLAIYVLEDQPTHASTQPITAPANTAQTNSSQHQVQPAPSVQPRQPGTPAGADWRSWATTPASSQAKTLYRCHDGHGGQIITETPAAGCSVVAN